MDFNATFICYLPYQKTLNRALNKALLFSEKAFLSAL